MRTDIERNLNNRELVAAFKMGLAMTPVVIGSILLLSGCGVLWSNVKYSAAYACQAAGGTTSVTWLGSSYTNITQYLTLDGPLGAITNGSGVVANVGSSGAAYGTGIQYIKGQVNQAISFNGTTDYVDIQGTAGFANANTTFSVSLWFNAPPASTGGYLVAKGAAAGGAQASGFSIAMSPTGQILAQLKDNAGAGAQTAYDTSYLSGFNDGSWHELVVVFQTDTVVNANNILTIYTDGVLNQNLMAHPSANPYGANVGSDLSLGARVVPSSPQNFFNGALDEVTFWNTALTPAVVQSLYTCQVVGH